MNSLSANRSSMEGHDGESAVKGIAEVIRGKSSSGKLASQKEVFEGLLDGGVFKTDNDQPLNQFEVLMEKALAGNDDLIKLQTDEEEPRFYSSRFMDESYAKILIRKESSPLLLMAEIVRQNSALYPRPVPLDIFREPPFSFAGEEISGYLKRMSEETEYQDIAQTTTSVGTVFLYSNHHLDSSHASMLAEWLDVGQADNP